MILRKIKIENFLSINGALSLDLDPNVTVLLGANDHGKSNILQAITCLNKDRSIGNDDKNWDAADDKEPAVSFIFSLSSQERETIIALAEASSLSIESLMTDDELLSAGKIKELESLIFEAKIREIEREQDEPADEPEAPAPNKRIIGTAQPTLLGQRIVQPAAQEFDEDDEEQEELEELDHDALAQTLVETRKTQQTIKDTRSNWIKLTRKLLKTLSDPDGIHLTFVRRGIEAPLTLAGHPLSDYPQAIEEFFEESIPRVEIFSANTGSLPDSVKAEQIMADEYEFLQGIFFYAGLDPRESQNLYKRTSPITN